MNLAEQYVKKIKSLPPESNYTWDDFFDEMKVPVESRTDFAVAAILKQAKTIHDEYSHAGNK